MMNKQEKRAASNKKLDEVLKQENPQTTKQKQKQMDAYNAYIKEITPTHCLPLNMAKAFLVGGAICVLGQVIMNIGMNQFHLDKELAASWTSLLLVLLSVVLTGFNIYPSLGKFGGAGALVPITGFANSVAAPAIEYDAEGQVYGKGCQIFSIAGPVILYGIVTSWILGIIYLIWLNCTLWS